MLWPNWPPSAKLRNEGRNRPLIKLRWNLPSNASGGKMPDREFDHRKESAGLKTAVRQIEERMKEISQAAEDKITETVRRWNYEHSAKAS
jgi:hypothetical protein